jgi:hypothetical protein
VRSQAGPGIQPDDPGVGALLDESSLDERVLTGPECLAAEDVHPSVLRPIQDADDPSPHPEVEIGCEVVVDVAERILLLAAFFFATLVAIADPFSHVTSGPKPATLRLVDDNTETLPRCIL